jgi:hypothetical protein
MDDHAPRMRTAQTSTSTQKVDLKSLSCPLGRQQNRSQTMHQYSDPRLTLRHHRVLRQQQVQRQLRLRQHLNRSLPLSLVLLLLLLPQLPLLLQLLQHLLQ